MEKEQFLELLDKYISGKASPEEEQQLLNFYGSFQAEADQLPDMEQLGDKMLIHVMEKIQKDEILQGARQKILWKKIAIAAILLITTITGIYSYTKNTVEREQFTEINVENDIAPGYNKAVLKLADGSEISLNDASNGLIARQGDISITKTAAGQIAYKKIDGELNTTVASAINIIQTPKGGKYQIILPDGSKVWLNSASSLRFPTTFTGGERKVKLTGEAYFEIAHNKKVPFRVESNNQIVEVLGTHFNINSYDDEAYTKTTLMEGSVRVILRSSKSKSPKTQLLKPGEQSLTDSSQSEIRIESTDTEKANAWKDGHFKFKDTPMQDVMKEIARWYDVELVYEGKIPTDEFTGYISNEVNISSVLKIMELSGDIKFTIKGKALKITSSL